MSALPHYETVFALRRQQAAELRAGRKPEAMPPADTVRQITEQSEGERATNKPTTLTAADSQSGRLKIPSPLFLTGGSVNFY